MGGVLLNLADEQAVAEGFATVVRKARAARREADVWGAYVQRMAAAGQEVIVGAVQDPQFGAQVMFGAGGVEVEGQRDDGLERSGGTRTRFRIGVGCGHVPGFTFMLALEASRRCFGGLFGVGLSADVVESDSYLEAVDPRIDLVIPFSTVCVIEETIAGE